MPTLTSDKTDDEVFSQRYVLMCLNDLRFESTFIYSEFCRLSTKEQGVWNGFMNSVNARMNVAKIVDELRQDAALTFDFVVLIVIAG